MESLLWNHCYGIIAVESLLWNHGYGIISGDSLGALWRLGWPWGGHGLGRSILLQNHCVFMHLSSRPPVLHESGEHRYQNSWFFTANSRVRRHGVAGETFTHILLSRQNPYRVNLFGEHIVFEADAKQTCGLIDVESLLWNHCCGIVDVESLLWNHGCGILAVEALWALFGGSLEAGVALGWPWGDLGLGGPFCSKFIVKHS